VLLTTHDHNGIAAHLPEIVCLNKEVIAAGPPRDVLRPDVLERTYGARMEVLEHGGMPVVVDDREQARGAGDTGTVGRIVRLPLRGNGR
jgi:ABC-type Mn2+/Zn2+ transport system ATPase subunit